MLGKWVLAPAAALVLGYYVVGPKLGKTGVKPKTPTVAPSQARVSEPTTDVPSAPAPAKHVKKAKPVGPDVDVTVKPAFTDGATQVQDEPTDTPPPVTPKKHHKKKVSTDSAATNSLDSLRDKKTLPPANDEGGSAGSTTAG